MNHNGLFILLSAKLVCCGFLGLAAAGLLGGVVAWLLQPEFWLLAASLAVAALLLARRMRARPV